MAENTLGIKGSLDISDIESEINKLLESLNRIGVDTSKISAEISTAFSDIGKSTVTGLKTQTQAIEEYSKSLEKLVAERKAVSDEIKTGSVEWENESKKIAEIENSIKSYQRKIAKLKSEKVELLKNPEATAGEIAYIDNLIAKLQAKISKNQSTIENINKIGKALQENKARLIEIDEEIENIKSKKADEAMLGNEVSLKTRLRQLTVELQTLQAEYRSLSDAEKESAKGQELQNKISTLMKQAGMLKDTVKDVNREISASASDTKVFSGISEGLDLVVSGFGAASGAIGLFGAKEEDLIAIQTKVQSAMAVSNALKTMQNTLQKESNLMVGIATVQQQAHATAIAIKTAAEGRGVAVTLAATAAQKAFNAVAKMNPYVLLAMSLVSVVGALAALTIGLKKNKEEEEKRQKAMEQSRKEQERLVKSQEEISTAVGKARVGYIELQAEWNKLKTTAEKDKWIKDNSSNFEKLGFSINSVKTAEDIFVNNTNAVVSAIIARAVAQKQAEEAADKLVELQKKRDKLEKEQVKYKTAKAGDDINTESYRGTRSQISNSQKRVEKRYNRSSNSYITTEVLDESGVEAENRRRAANAQATRDKKVNEIKKEEKEVVDNVTKAYQKQFDAEKKLQALGDEKKGGNTGGGKNDNTAEEAARTRQRLFEIAQKANADMLKLDKEFYYSQEELAISSMEEGTQRELRQMKLDLQKKLDAVKEEEQRMKEEIYNKNKAVWEAENKDKTKVYSDTEEGRKGAEGVELSPEQIKMLENNTAIILNEYNAQLKKKQQMTLEAEREANTLLLAMSDDYYDKKLAIDQRYDIEAQKIRENTQMSDNEKNTRLQINEQNRKRDKTELEVDNFKKNLNWDVIFGDLGNLDKVTLQTVKEQLQEFIEVTKELTPSDIKEVQEALEQIDGELMMKDSIGALRQAHNEYKAATADVKRYKKELEEANKANDPKKAAKAQENLTKAQRKQITSAKKVQKANDTVSESLSEMSSCLKDLSSMIGGTAGKLMNLASVGIDTANTMSDNFGKIKQGAIDLESAVAILAIIQAAFTAIQKIGDLFGFMGDTKEYDKAKEQYEGLIDIWDELIEKKQEYIDISYGEEAKKAADEIERLSKAEARAAREVGKKYLDSGNGLFTDAKGTNQRQGMTGEGWRQLYNALDYGQATRVASGNMKGLFDLTAEQLQNLKENAPVFWAQLDSDVQDYLNKIIKCNETIEETKEKMKEAYTGVSFDSFYEEFVSVLTDMDADASDFANSFEDYLKNAILQSLMANKYKGRIKALYEEWAKDTESGGLTAEEVEKLRESERKIAEDMLNDRNALADVFDWSSNLATADTRGFEGMSQDTGEELNGRFAALQVSNEQILQNVMLMSTTIDSIVELQTTGNRSLEQIVINTNPLVQMGADIAEMNRTIKERL